MKYTRETLLQIFMNGSLTEEAQKAFDRLMREDPEFAQTVTNVMAERMDAVSDETVDRISSRLDTKVEAIWVKNRPSKIARFFRVGIRGALALTGFVVLGYLISAIWPKLLMVFPQIDLGGYNPANVKTVIQTSIPKVKAIKLAPPVIVPTESEYPMTSVSIKPTPEKNSSKKAFVVPKGDFIEKSVPPKVEPVKASSKNVPDPPKVDDVSLAAQGVFPESSGSVMALATNVAKAVMTITVIPTPMASGSSYITQVGDSMRLVVETDKDQIVDVTVVGSMGNLVRQLYQGFWNAGSHFVDWNGKDDAGQPVFPGNYTIVVQAGDKKMSGVVTINHY